MENKSPLDVSFTWHLCDRNLHVVAWAEIDPIRELSELIDKRDAESGE